MDDRRISIPLVLVLMTTAAVIGGVVVWMTASPAPAPPPSPRFASLDAEWEKAISLQKSNEWPQAVEAWDELLKKLPESEAVRRADAQSSRDLCEREKSRQPLPLETPAKVAEEHRPQAERPAKIAKADLVTWYPVGKSTRGVATLRMDGRGTNHTWGIKSEVHFTYLTRVAAETTVLASDPEHGRLRFRHRVPEVSQTLVVNEASFEFAGELNPLASIVWDEVDTRLKEYALVYRRVRQLTDLVNLHDPGLKRTLTGAAKGLGLDAPKSVLPESAALSAQIERLSGAVLEMEYLSGFGITEIRCVEGPRLTERELLHLADTISLSMDYHLFPAANKQVGEEWSVDVRDVGGLFAVAGLETRATGVLHLKRNKPPAGQTDLALLGVPGGELDLLAWSDGADHSARIGVKSGTIEFSLSDKIIRKARMSLQVNTLWQDPNSLLFQTKGLRDLKTEAHYDATVVPAEKGHP